MLALIVGTLLAVGALAFVLYPLIAGPVPVRRIPVASAPSSKPAEHEAVVALREIEFDRVTGKLSDADYEELKARYTARALQAMRAGSSDGSSAGADDAIEAAVRAYRERMKSCATCGPRPEPDAVYCSNCGRYLPGACEGCGAAITESSAAFCASCGRQLAA
ncbi:MAG TPA: zinc ribbon domain-containing protein [Gemmatimonadaceae bacterium]|nr:zinc ribbon domain-containing protein [Gemmatimonadaceae bacterium]